MKPLEVLKDLYPYFIPDEEWTLGEPHRLWMQSEECHRFWDYTVTHDILAETSKEVLEAAVCLGSYCAEEAFSYLMMVEGCDVEEALLKLNIIRLPKIPLGISFTISNYGEEWEQKDSSKGYKGIYEKSISKKARKPRIR